MIICHYTACFSSYCLVLRRKRGNSDIWPIIWSPSYGTFISSITVSYDSSSPVNVYLGRPSHMTHDGDQLASKSLSWVWGSSSSCSCSSTMLTSSTRSCTEGEAALAFKVPTASLWLRYVKSCPLILNRTSPEGAGIHLCYCCRYCIQSNVALQSVDVAETPNLAWFVRPSTGNHVVGRWLRRLAAPRSCCPSLLQQSCPETRGVLSSQWCASPYRIHTGKGPAKRITQR